MNIPMIYKGFKGFIEQKEDGTYFGEIAYLNEEADHIVWREGKSVDSVSEQLKNGVDHYKKLLKDAKLRREYVGV